MKGEEGKRLLSDTVLRCSRVKLKRLAVLQVDGHCGRIETCSSLKWETLHKFFGRKSTLIHLFIQQVFSIQLSSYVPDSVLSLVHGKHKIGMVPGLARFMFQ